MLYRENLFGRGGGGERVMEDRVTNEKVRAEI